MTSAETRRIRVKLFAGAKQIAGAAELDVPLAAAATVGDLRAALVAREPNLEPLVRRALIAVNHEFAVDATIVPADAELALIPPVSGG